MSKLSAARTLKKIISLRPTIIPVAPPLGMESETLPNQHWNIEWLDFIPVTTAAVVQEGVATSRPEDSIS